MTTYEASAVIDAPVDVVWAVLQDGAAYPTWGSGVERVEGTIAEGAKVKVFSSVSPGRAFPVRVHLDPARSTMTWTGGMPLGLFRGVRTFTVVARGGGSEVTMREVFSGPLLGPITKKMPDLGPSFTQFVTALKARAEHVAAGG